MESMEIAQIYISLWHLQVLVCAHGDHGQHEVGVEHGEREGGVDDGVDRDGHDRDGEPVEHPLGRRHQRGDEI